MLQRVIDSLRLVSDHILVTVAWGQQFPPLDAGDARVDCIRDLYPGKSALGGIYTGLSASDCKYNLVVAADMPFLNPGLLHHLIGINAGFDVVMPRIHGVIEPLHAVYSKDCLPLIGAQLERGELQIRVFLQQVRVKYVEAAEIEEFDPGHLSFFNINTPDDLQRAQEIASDVGNC